MSNTNSSNSAAVPEAKSALNRFKYEVANELGVPLTDGYNGNLTSKQNGSVGGYMVKKMIEAQERQMSSGDADALYPYFFRTVQPDPLCITEEGAGGNRSDKALSAGYGDQSGFSV